MVDKPELAVKDFDEVINLQSDNPHAYFGRGFALKGIGEFHKAATDFEKVKFIIYFKRLENQMI